MLELLTGTGLAVSAGLNAYIPLLFIGLTSRFTGLVELPAGWAWLQNEWVLVILAVLLVVEFFADKIPGVDSVNDVIQTIVRPTSGGLAFGSGTAATTVAVTDPAQFFTSNAWVPIVIGALMALGVHGAKALGRPAVNAATFGLAAPIMSVVEDAGAVVMSILAIVVPILVIVGLIGVLWLLVSLARRSSRIRAAKRARRSAPA